MGKNSFRILIVAALALLAARQPARLLTGSQGVRVGLFTSVRSVNLGPGVFTVTDASGQSSHLSWGMSVAVAAVPSGVQVGNKVFHKYAVFEPDETYFVSVNGRPYRGRLEFRRSPSGLLTVVNELPVDDYVQGILLHEVNPEWPVESLKAQAVISRSYALRNKGRHGRDGYDLCAESHCQVYGGKSSERDVTNRVVQDTRGQVLLHGGQVVSAVFHSACGGSTENSDDAWQGPPVSFLRSVRCPWCKDSPHFKWSAQVSTQDIAKNLRAAGHDIGQVRSLKVLSRTRSGRVVEVRVYGSKGSVDMPSNRFRLLLNGRVVRSTFWSGVSQRRDSWHFIGRGWGHGVGLCQWGAKGMADRGKSYVEILRHYYKGVTVSSLRI